MAVLYRIQKLVERDSKEISILWKVFAICVCATTAVAALISYISQGKLFEGFGGVCILESHLKFKEITHASHSIKLYNEYDAFYDQDSKQSSDRQNNTSDFDDLSNSTERNIQIDIGASEWGSETYCQFCQYTPAMSVIVGVFWATMFTVCPRGGINRRGLRQSWRIIPAAFAFFLTTGIFSALALSRLKKNLAAFCTEFFSVTNTTSCTDKIDSFTGHFHEDNVNRSVFKWIDTSVISLWISTVCWLLGAFLMLLRFFCLVDFQISYTTVTSNRPNDIDTRNASDSESSLRKSLLKKNVQDEMVTSV